MVGEREQRYGALPLKILIIASLGESLVNFRGPLIKAMLAKGEEVHVAAPNIERGSAVHESLCEFGVIPHPIQMSRTGLNPYADLKSLASCFCLMRNIRPDLVLAYTIKPVIYGSLAAWLARVPRRFALITGLGYAFVNEALGSRWLIRLITQLLYKISLSHVNAVFFQNQDDAELFRRNKIFSQEVPCYIVNGSGVDLDKFAAKPLPGGAPTFLLIARLLGDKGVREYIAAARIVKLEFPQLTFNLVGWIDSNPDAIGDHELKQWVREGVVKYLGKLADVRAVLEQSSVYVLPSYREGIPRTVLEAMAMGRPVITTDAPGCRQTVREGENGFLVPVKSVQELADAMLRFARQPELMQTMGQRSRKMAEEKFDVHQVNHVMMRQMGLQ